MVYDFPEWLVAVAVRCRGSTIDVKVPTVAAVA